jgi:predicted methyltransferase
VRVERELADRLPDAARGLDLVYEPIFFRDLESMGVDRRLMLARAYEALHPGGRLVVMDRATPPQPGAVTPDLHAAHADEARNARREIEQAGFRFASEGRFLRSSTEASDWNSAPSANPTALETQDRFVMVFTR